MLVLVARSKLVPDFALSLHIVHLFIVSFYSHSPPRNWLWWGLQCVSAAVMTSLGIWCCRWRELSPITFGASATTRGPANKGDELAPGESPLPDSLTVCDEEQELGYGRGKGRGRRDRSVGAYEMVGLKAGTATDE